LEQPTLKVLPHGLSQGNFEMVISYILQMEIHGVLLCKVYCVLMCSNAERNWQL